MVNDIEEKRYKT